MFSEEYINLFREKTENLQTFIKDNVYDKINKDKLDDFCLKELPDVMKEKAKEELKKCSYDELLNMKITDKLVKENVVRVRLFILLIFNPIINENKLEEFVKKVLENVEFEGDLEFVINQLCNYIYFYKELTE